jgi:hypothetical protein
MVLEFTLMAEKHAVVFMFGLGEPPNRFNVPRQLISGHVPIDRRRKPIVSLAFNPNDFQRKADAYVIEFGVGCFAASRTKIPPLAPCPTIFPPLRSADVIHRLSERSESSVDLDITAAVTFGDICSTFKGDHEHLLF